MRFQKKLFYGIIDRRKEYKREMEKTNRKYQAYIQILKEELHPAMGMYGTDCAGLCGSGSQKRTRMSAGQSCHWGKWQYY